MDTTETEELEKIRKKAMDEVSSALQALENKFPGITEGAAALAGSGVGAAASFGALYTLGTTGVSAAGINGSFDAGFLCGETGIAGKRSFWGDLTGYHAVAAKSTLPDDACLGLWNFQCC